MIFELHSGHLPIGKFSSLERETDTLAELFSRDFLLELWEEVC